MPMRLPYLPERAVDDQRRALYEAFLHNVAGNFPDITTTRPDGSLVGPWGVWMQVPAVGGPFMELITNIRAMPGLSDQARQVVILTVGAKYHSAYEIYAHTHAARRAGLTDPQIDSLLSGARAMDLAPEHTVAGDIAAALVHGGVLPRPLYDRGLAVLGQTGLNAVVFTVAQYSFVATMLNAYDVPDETPEPASR